MIKIPFLSPLLIRNGKVPIEEGREWKYYLQIVKKSNL